MHVGQLLLSPEVSSSVFPWYSRSSTRVHAQPVPTTLSPTLRELGEENRSVMASLKGKRGRGERMESIRGWGAFCYLSP